MDVKEAITEQLIKFPPAPSEEYLVKGAMLLCDGNGMTSKLQLPKDHEIHLPGGPQINMNDFVPNVNIMPFEGYCPLKKADCIPLTTTPWEEPNEEHTAGDQPAVTIQSFLFCDYGGVIIPLDSGQSFVEQFLASKLREIGYYLGMFSEEKIGSLALGFAAALIENYKPQMETVAEILGALPGLLNQDPSLSARLSASVSNDINVVLNNLYNMAEYKDAFYFGKSLGDVLTIAVGIYGTVEGIAMVLGGIGEVGGGGALTASTGGAGAVVAVPLVVSGIGTIALGGATAASGVAAIGSGFGNLGKDWDNFQLSKSNNFGNSKNLKKVDDKYLRKLGIDAHDIKKDLFGKNNISKYDLYVDKDTGELLAFRKGGVGEGTPTGYHINDFKGE